jgi:hypothetical protein
MQNLTCSESCWKLKSYHQRRLATTCWGEYSHFKDTKEQEAVENYTARNFSIWRGQWVGLVVHKREGTNMQHWRQYGWDLSVDGWGWEYWLDPWVIYQRFSFCISCFASNARLIVWRTICKGCRWELSWIFFNLRSRYLSGRTEGNFSQGTCIQETIPARTCSKRVNRSKLLALGTGQEGPLAPERVG